VGPPFWLLLRNQTINHEKCMQGETSEYVKSNDERMSNIKQEQQHIRQIVLTRSHLRFELAIANCWNRIFSTNEQQISLELPQVYAPLCSSALCTHFLRGMQKWSRKTLKRQWCHGGGVRGFSEHGLRRSTRFPVQTSLIPPQGFYKLFVGFRG